MSNSVTSFSVTPALEDIKAAVTVNGEAVASGQPSQVNALNVGENPIAIIVTAEDGTPKTYMVTVNRLPYDFMGYLPPLAPHGSSVINRGTVVPVKFQLMNVDGQPYADAAARVYIAKITGGVVGAEEEAKIAGGANAGNLCRNDPAVNQYIFNWQTKGLAKGKYQVRIDLEDGFSYTIQVELR